MVLLAGVAEECGEFQQMQSNNCIHTC